LIIGVVQTLGGGVTLVTICRFWVCPQLKHTKIVNLLFWWVIPHQVNQHM